MKHLLGYLCKWLAIGTVISGAVACGDDDTDKNPPPAPQVTITKGIVTEKSAVLFFTASDADRMAWYWTPTDEDIAYTAADIFELGEVVTVDGIPVSRTVSDLQPDTDYKVYAAAAVGETFSELAVLDVRTPPRERMLSLVSQSKTGFTYHVEVPENTTYQHCYIEGWYFDYMLASAMESEGDEFDKDVFLWNMLVDFGIEKNGSQDFEWEAGQLNEKRDEKAYLVGGHHYYALCSLFRPENDWYGTPEALRIEMDPAGKSTETVTVIDEVITFDGVRIRMECDSEKVNFFFYNLYKKADYDAKMAEVGKEGMMDYLFEYGYVAGNTYTDTWKVDPGASFMLAILGVDNNGDIFFLDKQYDIPKPEPKINLQLKPYERDMAGYHAYDTFELYVEPQYFDAVASDAVMWVMKSKAELDMYLEMFGTTLETLSFEYFTYLSPYPLPEDQQEMLNKDGYIHTLLTSEAYGLYPDTEYCYIVAIPTGDDANPFKIAYTTARTEEEYGGGEPEAEYSAYLGNWTLTGKSSQDYATKKSYTLRFETLTTNRSFKVYGWGDSEVAQKYPFEVRYHPSTKQISIEGEQLLGVETTDRGDMQVVFHGLFSYAGMLSLVAGYSGTIYEGSLYADRISFFPNYFSMDGGKYEFKTLAYSGYLNGEFQPFDGDDYSIVEFTCSRATNQSGIAVMRSAASRPAGETVRHTEQWWPFVQPLRPTSMELPMSELPHAFRISAAGKRGEESPLSQRAQPLRSVPHSSEQ